MKKIKVLIIDDSAVVRSLLSRELSQDPEIDVVGTASDPFIARDMIVQLKPDVLTLDIEMPKMDGLTFLERLMEFYPLPVIIISSMTSKGSSMALDAFQTGAIDVICKPNSAYSVQEVMVDIIKKVKMASRITVTKKVPNKGKEKNRLKIIDTTQKIIGIGASTGGVNALQDIMVEFPRNTPGIVIVQHMPEKFTTSFAERLNAMCDMEVREAQEGDYVANGRILIAPGNFHMEVHRSGGNYIVHLNQKDRVSGHRPSVDVLFHSLANHVGRNAVAAILTGMGHDGAEGLKALKDKGAYTLAQDEASCVVYGMPKVAVEKGAVNEVSSLNKMAERLLLAIEKKG